MLVCKAEENGTPMVNSIDALPQILLLNAGGEPLNWIRYQDSAEFAVKGKILWSVGQYEVRLRGGINAATGKQSVLKMDSIIAVNNNTSPSAYRRHAPALTNRELFARDRNICAYCGRLFTRGKLTRDHVQPRSKGGLDVWTNVVTSCRPCNQRKDAHTPEQVGMKLIYVPYEPSFHEALILKNHRILADQMQYLLKGVPRESRLHKDPLPIYSG